MRVPIVVAGWLLAAAAATATGVAGVAVIGRSISGPTGDVMDAAEIERQLAAAPAPSATVRAPSATTAPGGVRKLFETPAGTVVARCDGSAATIESWSPANGYQVREVDQGHGDEAEIRFERDRARVRVRITCTGGVPQLRVDD